MPVAKQIAIQHMSIIVPSASPTMENQPVILMTTKNENADEQSDGYSSSSNECQVIVSSSSQPRRRSFEAISTLSEEPTRMSYQFDQWDALVQREGHEAYSVQTQFSNHEEVCRNQLCDWCYSIVDEYDLDRSTAAAAMSYFDRLVPRLKGRYWIITMAACLNIAIKVNSCDRRIIDPEKMAELASTISSRDKSYTSGDILNMEICVLKELDWFMNPPVPQSFLDIISPILMHSPMCQYDLDDEGNAVIDEKVRHLLCATSQFLCELSVTDTFFSTKSPSAIAIAAVLVAMDVMRFPAGASKWVLSLPLDYNIDELNVYAQHLHKLYEGNEPECTYWSNRSTGEDTNNEEAKGVAKAREAKARTITPLKEEIPPNIKRTREETIEARSIEGEAVEGSTNASKKKKMK